MTALSADRPSVDPKDDLFGYAPFAERLAESICSYSDSDGLVFAIYGSWGSGKSTVLNYVQYYLEQRPEEKRPILVKFNPWWFSGQEDLARTFLGQLQAVLSTKKEKFEQLGDFLDEYREGISGIVDITGFLVGVGGSGGTIGKVLSSAKRKPKDVPALKEAITSCLLEEGKRILVVIDDIDRLTPEETRKLFTVIKALADFPYVVYLLAFDRKVAAQALKQPGLPGERYLEKIIQVPFELPSIDRFTLRMTLNKRLDEVLHGMPEELFDHSYWMNVYQYIDPLIKVPRDVVRLTNTLAVTYPSVCGEVNPVDFIALESLRVILPDLYDVIRAHPDRFHGCSDDDRYKGYEGDQNATQAFHERWVNEVPEESRTNIRALLEHIFPKIGQTVYGPDCLAVWKRELRVCHPDVLQIYFRLTVPAGAVSRSEMMALLNLAGTPADFGDALVRAKKEKRTYDLSKAYVLLEQLKDHEKDIQYTQIPSVIQALLNVGDELIDPNSKLMMLGFGETYRASHLIYHLLKRVGADQRAGILERAIQSGNAVAVQSYFLLSLDKEITRAEDSGEDTLLDTDEVKRLKLGCLKRVRMLSRKANFVKHPELPELLFAWRQWSSEAEVRTWCDETLASDDALLNFLQGFLQYTFPHHRPLVNPTWLESYLDTSACAGRLRDLQQNDKVPAGAQEAVSQYLKEFDMLQEGKNPDGDGAFGD